MLMEVVGQTRGTVEAALAHIRFYSNVILRIPALADESLVDMSFEGTGEGVAEAGEVENSNISDKSTGLKVEIIVKTDKQCNFVDGVDQLLGYKLIHDIVVGIDENDEVVGKYKGEVENQNRYHQFVAVGDQKTYDG